MAMRVLQPIYEKGNRGTKVVTQRSGGPWSTAARGNLYGRHGAGSYIRQPGYAVGPQRGRAGYSGSFSRLRTGRPAGRGLSGMRNP